MSKETRKKGESNASNILKEGATFPKPKSVAGSALSQAPRRTIEHTSAKKASAVLYDGRSSSKAKSAAGSALSQVQNPRTGRYVKIDKASGTIIAHKKSVGAYKDVPIAEKSHKQK